MRPRVLRYDVSGEGSPLVLIPGGLTGWVSWAPLQVLLARTRTAIRVQPIYNELGSAGQPRDPGHSRHVELESLLLTLHELGIDRADFAGWSAGGKMLLDFAVANPGAIRSLTLIEPAASWILDELGEIDPELRDYNHYLWGLAGKEITEDDLAIFLSSAGFSADPAQARADPYWRRALPHRMTLSWLDEGLMATDMSIADLRTIRAPALVTKGTVTEPWERRVVDLLGEHLLHARVVEFEGGHAHHLENADAFVAEMENHLDSVGSQ